MIINYRNKNTMAATATAAETEMVESMKIDSEEAVDITTPRREDDIVMEGCDDRYFNTEGEEKKKT